MGLKCSTEKYTRVRNLMAVSHGSLQDPLREAFIYHLDAVRAGRDLPEGLREAHDALLVQVTRVIDRDGMGTYTATSRR